MKPKLHHIDLAVLEDELKLEFDVLKSLVKKMSAMKEQSVKLLEENQALTEAIKGMKLDLNGKSRSFLLAFATYPHKSLESQQKISQLLQSQSSAVLLKPDRNPTAIKHLEHVVSKQRCLFF